LVAGTLVAFVSSLPEFTSSLVAVLTTNDFSSACGNLVGGNIFRTFALGVACIFFIMCMKKAKTTSTQVFLTFIQILVSIVFILSMFFHESIAGISGFIFMITDIFVILAYVATLFFMVKKDKNTQEGFEIETDSNRVRKLLMKIKISHVMITFVITSSIIVGSAFCIALSTD
jgi:Ca2+/Na+ antiporter